MFCNRRLSLTRAADKRFGAAGGGRGFSEMIQLLHTVLLSNQTNRAIVQPVTHSKIMFILQEVEEACVLQWVYICVAYI